MGIHDKSEYDCYNIKWIGTHFIGVLKNKTVLFYEKCLHGSLILCKGDYVIISNTDNPEEKNISKGKAAKIVHLYEQDKSSGQNSFRAIVKWFSHASSIPKESFDCDKICIDFDRELIEDYRYYENDICLKKISNKCRIIYGPLGDNFENLLRFSDMSQADPLFLCRFKYIKIKESYRLVPINFLSKNTNVYKNNGHQKSSLIIKELYNRKRRFAFPILGKGVKTINIINEPNKVSPIKIIGGRSVVKLSQKSCEHSINNHDLNLSIPEFSLNCKNLNQNLESNDIKFRNYSIVKPNGISNERKIKIKLRILDQSLSTDSVSIEKYSPYETSTIKLDTSENKIQGIRRKSILKSKSKTQDRTPKRNIKLSDVIEKRIFVNEHQESFNQKNKVGNNFINSPLSQNKNNNPSVKKRRTVKDSIDYISNQDRQKRHDDVTLKSLPCREKEFYNIYSFLESKIQENCSGCMYISGVPGTGKTATVTNAIHLLQQKAAKLELNKFNFVEINGMRLSEPRQAYVEIYKQLTGVTVTWDLAHHKLEKKFSNQTQCCSSTILLVDELDILCNKRQDVVYSLLDWPSKSAAHLVVISIANTMDLPEKLLMGKVTSRLGLTRLSFLPYTHKQLKEIVISKLFAFETFKNDAVELVARKVAAVSGDARRALDICKRASELAKDTIKTKNPISPCGYVSMAHVQHAINEMIASTKVQFVKSISFLQQIFLRAVIAEVIRTGIEETTFMNVYCQVESISQLMGMSAPNIGCAFMICSSLSSQRLLICESGRYDLFKKILLNVSIDDIHYALNTNS